jgi:uncharacterized Zn finger protein (UPF0148 family)
MGMTATCPGCGAPLPVAGSTNNITCTFCGTNFKVDLSETAPKLNRQPYTPSESQPAPQKAEDYYGSTPEANQLAGKHTITTAAAIGKPGGYLGQTGALDRVNYHHPHDRRLLLLLLFYT